jgi:hypothetical protein
VENSGVEVSILFSNGIIHLPIPEMSNWIICRLTSFAILKRDLVRLFSL